MSFILYLLNEKFKYRYTIYTITNPTVLYNIIFSISWLLEYGISKTYDKAKK